MSEIDWSKAPEGATHYAPARGKFVSLWARLLDEGKYQYMDIAGTRGWSDGAQPEPGEMFVGRPSPQWNGDGLPPVGVVCEYQSGYVEEPREYSKCEIIAHFRGESGRMLAAFTYVAHDGVIGLGRGAPAMFRPIRTPEQIATEARIKAWQEWLKYIEREYGLDTADKCENILVAAEAKRAAQ